MTPTLPWYNKRQLMLTKWACKNYFSYRRREGLQWHACSVWHASIFSSSVLTAGYCQRMLKSARAYYSTTGGIRCSFYNFTYNDLRFLRWLQESLGLEADFYCSAGQFIWTKFRNCVRTSFKSSRNSFRTYSTYGNLSYIFVFALDYCH